ncbi:MAG: TCR/Tet family MFS transporter [Deinococcaceae bacterium]
MREQKTAALSFILITMLIDVLGIGLVIPVMPAILKPFTVGPDEQAYWYGVLGALYGAMQFLFAPFLGAFSDRFGRRPVLLLSLLGLALDYVLIAMAPSLMVLVIGRIISGITGANFTVAQAYISDVTPPEKRAQSFGLSGAVFGIGFVLGPILGGLLGDQDPHLPFWVAAGLTGLNLLYGYFVLPESLTPENRNRMTWSKINPLTSLYALSRLRGMFGVLSILLLSSFGGLILQSTWILYTEFRFLWTPKDNGIALFCVGVVSAIVQGGLIRVLLPRLGETRAIVLGLFVTVLADLAYGLVQVGGWMYVIIFVSFLSSLAEPAVKAVISNSIDEREQGSTWGAITSLNSVMSVIAPLLGSALLARVSHLPRLDVWVGLPFFVCSSLNLLALFVAVYLWRRRGAIAVY